ncbi:DUF6188 family protein [Microbacterium sp. NPDC056052]|uniref:DUF6188 family protein n=1 Tax=Microbacterium sp. NPDC056052 TaxID=3345695 RepID=UPI0035DC1DB2
MRCAKRRGPTVDDLCGGVDATDSGQLQIRFGNGVTLTCFPSEAFEAWSVTLASGELFVCEPGGGITHWAGGVATVR